MSWNQRSERCYVEARGGSWGCKNKYTEPPFQMVTALRQQCRRLKQTALLPLQNLLFQSHSHSYFSFDSDLCTRSIGHSLASVVGETIMHTRWEMAVDPEFPCRCYRRELDRLNFRSGEEVEMISRWEDCEEKLESFIVV